MTGGTISLEAWVRRYGVPQLAAPRFRDDPPPGLQRMPLWRFFADPDAPAFAIMTASPAEVRQSGIDGPGFCYGRISRVWSHGTDGRKNIASIVMMAEEENVATINRASDRDLAITWLTLLSWGWQPMIEPLACCLPPMK